MCFQRGLPAPCVCHWLQFSGLFAASPIWNMKMGLKQIIASSGFSREAQREQNASRAAQPACAGRALRDDFRCSPRLNLLETLPWKRAIAHNPGAHIQKGQGRGSRAEQWDTLFLDCSEKRQQTLSSASQQKGREGDNELNFLWRSFSGLSEGWDTLTLRQAGICWETELCSSYSSAPLPWSPCCSRSSMGETISKGKGGGKEWEKFSDGTGGRQRSSLSITPVQTTSSSCTDNINRLSVWESASL